MADCGTASGYRAHRRRGEQACPACKAAAAEATRSLRASKPEYAQSQSADHRARWRAWSRLAKEFPDRFRELLGEELLKEKNTGRRADEVTP